MNHYIVSTPTKHDIWMAMRILESAHNQWTLRRTQKTMESLIAANAEFTRLLTLAVRETAGPTGPSVSSMVTQ